MPPTAPGSLSPATAADIIAYILQANGTIPGAQPLSPTSAVVIRSVALAQAPQVPAAPGRGQAAGDSRSRSGTRPAGASTSPRHHGGRRSAKLRAGHRRDAAEPRSGRLVDGAAQLPGLEPQPAHANHARQREEPQARLGVGDERRRREPADAARPQRHPLPRAHGQHRPGARRPHRRADLGIPPGPRPGRGDAQPGHLSETRFSSPQPMPAWRRSTRARASLCGRAASPIRRRATAPRPARS